MGYRNRKTNSFIKLYLTDFIGAHTSDVYGPDGNLEKCICIPIDKNMINMYEGSGYIYVRAMRCKKKIKGGWTHFLSPRIPIEEIKKLYVQGFNPPYVGWMKQDFEDDQPFLQHKNYVKNDTFDDE